MNFSTFLLALSLVHPDHDAARPIVIDGEFDDWRSIPPALIDGRDAPDAAVDLGEIRLTHDERFVWLMIDFSRTVNAQGLDGTAMLLFDADGNPHTGLREHGLEGVDIAIQLSPPSHRSPTQPFMGMSVRTTSPKPSAEGDEVDADRVPSAGPSVYDIGLHFGPTHAGRRMEFRIDRGAHLPQMPELFRGKHSSGKVVFLDADGNLADETDVFEFALNQPVAAAQQPDAFNAEWLSRSDDNAMRVLSWNVHRSAFTREAGPFLRTITAIEPDVLLLQELLDTTTAEDIINLLKQTASTEQETDWSVVIGKGGGDLRCAIASKFPLHRADAFDMVPLQGRGDQTLRAAAAIVRQGELNLLAVSVHLRCCGRAGGPEDLQRIEECRLLNELIAEYRKSNRIHGVIIAGDFNLVGSREPLEILSGGIDLDQTALTVVPAFQIDGLTNATWQDRLQPFAPGRLDYMLFSDSRLRLQRAWVHDSRDLSAAMHQRLGTTADDTTRASDHLPLIGEFVLGP